MLLIAGVLGAVAISWFYTLQWVTFISFIPSDEVATFFGLLSFFNNVIQPFGNLIYFSIVQGTNSHPLAFLLTTVPFNVIALLLLSTQASDGAVSACGAGQRRTHGDQNERGCSLRTHEDGTRVGMRR